MTSRRVVQFRAGVRASVVAAGLLTVLGAFAWASGLTGLFPSLGPSAYVLAVEPEAETSAPKRVVGSHAVGALAGFLAYHAVADGLTVVRPHVPWSAASMALAASGVLALAITVVVMEAADLRHAPACATTLIVALGLLTTATQAAVIVVAVVVLVVAQRLLFRVQYRAAAWLSRGD
ncbi:HPP family protein [Halomarina ordinaria]|uniref:HPP family protein n=1 Tax=Halomarina ordinaria TaxID=3033939 RepID=A0ABD5UEZ3_9EURY|nr:HPP family protein [Halomarina sp. PSRA2]